MNNKLKQWNGEIEFIEEHITEKEELRGLTCCLILT